MITTDSILSIQCVVDIATPPHRGGHVSQCRFVIMPLKHYALSHMQTKTFCAMLMSEKCVALREPVVSRRLRCSLYVPSARDCDPTVLLFFQFAHHFVSAVSVHHASNTKRGHDSAHARETAGEPVHPDLGEALLESCTAVAVVQIEAQEMERRRDELDRCWREELRGRGARYVALHFSREW